MGTMTLNTAGLMAGLLLCAGVAGALDDGGIAAGGVASESMRPVISLDLGDSSPRKYTTAKGTCVRLRGCATRTRTNICNNNHIRHILTRFIILV